MNKEIEYDIIVIFFPGAIASWEKCITAELFLLPWEMFTMSSSSQVIFYFSYSKDIILL